MADDREPMLSPDALAAVVTSGILIADGEQGVHFANDTCVELFWQPVAALLGHGWLDHFAGDARKAVADAAHQATEASTHSTVSAPIDIAGQSRWIRMRFNAIPNDDRGGWVATVDDVTAERELSRRATHDGLTGLPNRALLYDRLAQGLARMRRNGRPLAVVFLDLDRFKPVNDQHGHAVGDAVLAEVGRRIQAAVRASDTAARVGGDEFVLVLEGVGSSEAAAAARRVVSSVNQPFAIAGHELHLTICAGIAIAYSAATTPDELMAQADGAMYRAKAKGSGVELVVLPDPLINP
ncbi:MAG TPA: GGDEF domain-containing protein [Acidimicrobiales bacterium]